LGTLNNLRWLAVVGQTTAVLIVSLLRSSNDLRGFDRHRASAILNIVLSIAYPSSKRLTARGDRVLGCDITQLAVLCSSRAASGTLRPAVPGARRRLGRYAERREHLVPRGLRRRDHVAHVRTHSASLASRRCLHAAGPLSLGIWVSCFWASVFFDLRWRTRAKRRMSAALSDGAPEPFGGAGWAAAAAARLGIFRHDRAGGAGAGTRVINPHADDFRLCARRPNILPPSAPRAAGDSVLGARAIAAGRLLDDIAVLIAGGCSIVIDVQEGPPPKCGACPRSCMLGNLVENAADFAASEVAARAGTTRARSRRDGRWSRFAAEIFEQIGEPYVTSRPRPANPTTKGSHSELGRRRAGPWLFHRQDPDRTDRRNRHRAQPQSRGRERRAGARRD
jgi:hypothetical protein